MPRRSTTQIPYGAAELQATEPRALLMSFLFSTIVVQALAMLLSWWLTPPTDDHPPARMRPGTIPYRILPIPPIAHVVAVEGRRRASVIPTLAIPVPVADHPVDTAFWHPTIEELQSSGLEEGDPLSSGTVVEEGGTSVVEPEPAPFEPREVEPAVVVKVEPAYPPIAIRAAMEGNVYVQVWVDSKGAVRKAVVVKSDGEGFNQAALEAARGWVFTPAMMQGRPVNVWVTIPFRFRLHER
jgi:TonB family protein